MAITLSAATNVRIGLAGTPYLPSPRLTLESEVRAAVFADNAEASATAAAEDAATAEAAASTLTGALGASYLVGAASAGLSAERVVTDTATVSWDLGTGGQAKANVPDAGVTNAKLANMAAATIKGSVAGGVPADLSATQATSILNAFVGDSGTGGTKGSVPAPAAADAAGRKVLGAGGAWITPDMVLIEAKTISNQAMVDFTTGLSSTYDRYILVLDGVKPATDDVALMLRIGTGVGPTWQTTGYVAVMSRNRGGSTTPNVTNTTTFIGLTEVGGSGAGLGNATGEAFDGTVNFSNPDATDFCKFRVEGSYDLALGDVGSAIGAGRYNTAGAITGVRLAFSSGNALSGSAVLYALKKS